MSQEERVFYSAIEDDERFTYDVPTEAAEDYLENYTEGEEPEEIPVYAVRRVRLDRSFVSRLVKYALDGLYENLAEEYGDPDGLCADNVPEDSAKVLAAKAALIEAILADYQPWVCERAPELDEVVKVKDGKVVEA